MEIKQGMVQGAKMLEMIPVKTEYGRRKGISSEDCFTLVMGALLSGQIAAIPGPEGNAAGMFASGVPDDMPEGVNSREMPEQGFGLDAIPVSGGDVNSREITEQGLDLGKGILFAGINQTPDILTPDNSFVPDGNPGTQGLTQPGEADKAISFGALHAADPNMALRQDIESGEINRTNELAVGRELIEDASDPLGRVAEWKAMNGGISGLTDFDGAEPVRADHTTDNEIPEPILGVLLEEDGLPAEKNSGEKYVSPTRNNMGVSKESLIDQKTGIVSKEGLIDQKAGMNEEPLPVLEPSGKIMTDPVPQKIKIEGQQSGLYEKKSAPSMEDLPGSTNGEIKQEIRVMDGDVPVKSREEKFLPGEGVNSGGETAPKEGDSPISLAKTEFLSSQSQIGRVALDKLPARVGEFLHQVFINKKTNTWELQLEPEALGKLKVTVNWDQGKISAEFLAETSQAAKALENYLDALKQNLGQKNIDVSTLSINIAGQGMGGGFQGSPSGFYRKERGNIQRNDGLSVQIQEERDDTRGEVSVNYLV